MDPLSNPTPTPNPTPSPAPTPNPVSTPTPTPAPAPSPVQEPSVEPVSAPVSEPVVNPIPNPTPPPVVPSPVTTPPPVNPVINPTGNAPMNPAFQPDKAEISPTDPIMTPEPAKAPDPVEEELKAPMKAAGPVPGSIGSAVSGPSGEGAGMEMPVGGNPFDNMPKERAQSVSFNDPAVEPNIMDGAAPVKKVQNKKTLIALISIVAVIVVALLVVLIMQLFGNGSSSPAPNQNNSSNSQDSSSNSDSEPVSYTDTLSCTRNMTSSEIALFNDAISGAVNISAEFGDDNKLEYVSLVKSVVYSDEDKSKNEPVEEEVHEESAENLTSTNAAIYYLPLDSDNELLLDLDSIQENYEELEFTCELL